LTRIFKGEGKEIIAPFSPLHPQPERQSGCLATAFQGRGGSSGLFLHIRILMQRDQIAEMELEIGPNQEPGIFLAKAACWLGIQGNSEEEKKKPWGDWVHPSVQKKGLLIDANYRMMRPAFNFSLTCTPFPGARFTNFLFLLFFYIAKLHANHLGIEDYVIAADDTAKVGDKSVTEYAVEKVLAKKMTLPEIMRTPLLYYERFGFIYPEKEEFFSNLLQTGEAFVTNGPTGRPDEISRYLLDLKTVSVKEILEKARTLEVRP
jgi:hypothetical protein